MDIIGLEDQILDFKELNIIFPNLDNIIIPIIIIIKNNKNIKYFIQTSKQ